MLVVICALRVKIWTFFLQRHPYCSKDLGKSDQRLKSKRG